MKNKFLFYISVIAFASFPYYCGADETVSGEWVGNTDPDKGPLSGGVYESTICLPTAADIMYDTAVFFYDQAKKQNLYGKVKDKIDKKISPVVNAAEKLLTVVTNHIAEQEKVLADIGNKLEEINKEQPKLNRKLSTNRSKSNVEWLQTKNTMNALSQAKRKLTQQQKNIKAGLDKLKKVKKFLYENRNGLGRAGRVIEKILVAIDSILAGADVFHGISEHDSHKLSRGIANLTLLGADIATGTVSWFIMAGVGLLEIWAMTTPVGRLTGIDPLDIDKILTWWYDLTDESRKNAEDWLTRRWEEDILNVQFPDYFQNKENNPSVPEITRPQSEPSSSSPKVQLQKHRVYPRN